MNWSVILLLVVLIVINYYYIDQFNKQRSWEISRTTKTSANNYMT
jgi:uncharacterized protein (UPF0333 family)